MADEGDDESRVQRLVRRMSRPVLVEHRRKKGILIPRLNLQDTVRQCCSPAESLVVCFFFFHVPVLFLVLGFFFFPYVELVLLNDDKI